MLSRPSLNALAYYLILVHEEHVSDERFRARFRREIDAAQRVGERYTAPVLDSGPEDDPPWIATGYVPGLSLDQVVRRHGPLPTASVRAVADGLLRALKDIHDAGIVHRDLKPSNVMLTVDGTKVIDFGIARALETSAESPLTSTGMAVGSPGFMSPEQIQAQSVGPKSDVFTLGSVLMYAATGRLPFGHEASNQHAVMFQIVQDEPDLDGVDDPALRALISRCLTKDAAQRPDVDALLRTRSWSRRPRPRTPCCPPASSRTSRSSPRGCSTPRRRLIGRSPWTGRRSGCGRSPDRRKQSLRRVVPRRRNPNVGLPAGAAR
ncbi:serine/threonine-protein kinase [Streptomyces sp. NPDC058430]|uniref:serine/threonine-protein kinase n=1 Tax=Streptomyces sp. NPDC058430 TaxID=3346495 RepID=UPI003657BFDE